MKALYHYESLHTNDGITTRVSTVQWFMVGYFIKLRLNMIADNVKGFLYTKPINSWCLLMV